MSTKSEESIKSEQSPPDSDDSMPDLSEQYHQDSHDLNELRNDAKIDLDNIFDGADFETNTNQWIVSWPKRRRIRELGIRILQDLFKYEEKEGPDSMEHRLGKVRWATPESSAATPPDGEEMHGVICQYCGNPVDG